MSTPPISSVYNDGYIAEAYERYRQDPALVDESWRQFFQFAARLGGGDEQRPAAPDASLLRVAAAGAALVAAIRQFGHRAVQLDPLGAAPPGAPELEPAFHGVTEADLARVPASAIGVEGFDTAAEAIAMLRERYSSAVAYEFEHLADDEERRWLRQTIERGERARPLARGEKVAMLERLAQVDGLETFLELAYKGKKRFSIEGTDALVPMLDMTISESARRGAREVVISMAHRGRLNVLAHILEKPYATIFEEFEERRADANAADTTGDVKYHLGARGTREANGVEATVLLVPNPSHLEVVDPVLNGVARARQRVAGGDAGAATFDEGRVVPVCIHGDAAFPGEGVVAETFNLSRLRGYRVGGVVHIIVNNQVGFTTDPIDSRSTYYASDLAKGFEVPVVHVNGDDPEACIAAVRVATRYREKFRKDVVIDLVGYRRFGHNETDEPAITQPLLYKAIRAHPRPYQVYGARLVAEGVIPPDGVAEAAARVRQRLTEVHERFQKGEVDAPRHEPDDTSGAPPAAPVATAVPLERLRELNDAITRLPEGFTPQRAPQSELNKRRAALAAADGRVEFGHAESLAFAALAAEGISVRLTGQDAERGTFAHRMAVLHDVNSGAEYAPLAHLGGTASIEIYNSPLSETAVMGFEYGYSVEQPRTLVLWEAQYGDFVNVGQPIIDQFIAADRAKWGQDSGLVLLLPHGYEGQGPEHSSARLERFLQMCAEGNMAVVYPSTAAQHFHLLRRQAHRDPRRPLVVMTPKSLLRRREATSPVAELAGGRFQPVIDDAAAAPSEVRRVVFCTGKMYHDLADARAKGAAPHVALVRVEELYPWPHAELQAVLERYGAVTDVVWAQEEPRNMGAWGYAEPRLRALAGSQLGVRYVGRADRASPAEGYNSAHQVEQARIVAEALAEVVDAKGGRKSRAAAK